MTLADKISAIFAPYCTGKGAANFYAPADLYFLREGVLATIAAHEKPCPRCTGSGLVIEAEKADGSMRQTIPCPDCAAEKPHPLDAVITRSIAAHELPSVAEMKLGAQKQNQLASEARRSTSEVIDDLEPVL